MVAVLATPLSTTLSDSPSDEDRLSGENQNRMYPGRFQGVDDRKEERSDPTRLATGRHIRRT